MSENSIWILDFDIDVTFGFCHLDFMSMRFIVHGSSMAPAFQEGDRLFASSVPYWFFTPRQGDVVILQHPFKKKLILKRIAKVLPTGEYVVKGDNAKESTDSDAFGSVSRASLVARVLFSY